MHLHRVEGVGCHDPRSHSEHNRVCEDGRLWDVLSTQETLVVHAFIHFPLRICNSRLMTCTMFGNGKEIMSQLNRLEIYKGINPAHVTKGLRHEVDV